MRARSGARATADDAQLAPMTNRASAWRSLLILAGCGAYAPFLLEPMDAMCANRATKHGPLSKRATPGRGSAARRHLFQPSPRERAFPLRRYCARSRWNEPVRLKVSGGVGREPAGVLPGGVHYVDLRVAIALGDKRDFPPGGRPRRHAVARWVIGQIPLTAPVEIDTEDVPRPTAHFQTLEGDATTARRPARILTGDHHG